MSKRSCRVLVLGGLGMLGHRLMLTLDDLGYAVSGTARNYLKHPAPWLEMHRLPATNRLDLEIVLRKARPDVAINCIGWVRQRPIEHSHGEAILVNAVFPHWLADACHAHGIELIHISTDCIGDDDWYGSSKRLGEGIDRGIVLRSSFIGHELNRRLGLLEWFLQQKGSVDGHAGVQWNGLTTNELAMVIGEFVIPHLSEMKARIWEIAGPEIDKCSLLQLVNAAYGCGLEIRPVYAPMIDRRLDASEFNERFGYQAPAWPEMLLAMRKAWELGVQRVDIGQGSRNASAGMADTHPAQISGKARLGEARRPA